MVIPSKWWFQPPWKIWKSDWIIIPTIAENKIHVPNHQPDGVTPLIKSFSYWGHPHTGTFLASSLGSVQRRHVARHAVDAPLGRTAPFPTKSGDLHRKARMFTSKNDETWWFYQPKWWFYQQKVWFHHNLIFRENTWWLYREELWFYKEQRVILLKVVCSSMFSQIVILQYINHG